MTDLTMARQVAEDYLRSVSEQAGLRLALDDEWTREESWCWVFYYNSKAFLESGAFADQLTGNGPLVVEKRWGRLYELVAARPVEEQLRELARSLGIADG